MTNENDDYVNVLPENPGETTPPRQFWGMSEKTYCMLMHLSQLLNFSGAGIVVPIVMWALNKDESPTIDQHGKNVLNFILSMIIYAIGLTVTIIGIPLLIAVVIIAIVFPIIAAVKANDGIYWPYPLCIRFFK